jgi:hypothetical protein
MLSAGSGTGDVADEPVGGTIIGGGGAVGDLGEVSGLQVRSVDGGHLDLHPPPR